MNEPVEAGHLSVDLGTHPDHEQVRAAGLAAMREYEAEHGLFAEAERAKADRAVRWTGAVYERAGRPGQGTMESRRRRHDPKDH